MSSLPSGWRTERLGEVLHVRYGKALAPADRNPSGAYPVVGSAGRMTGTDAPLVSETVVVIGRKGNVGAIFLEPDGCWPIDTTYYSAVPEALDPRFLVHQLGSLRLERLDSSTATPSLRREDLEQQAVVIPRLEDQRRIVGILDNHLSRLDAAETYLHASQGRLESLTSSWFGRTGLASAPRLPLTDLLRSPLANGRSVPTRVGGFPVLRLTALAGDRVRLSERKGGDWDEGTARSFLVARGDVLVSRGNGSLRLVARGALVDEDPDQVAFPDTMIRIRPRSEVISPEYLVLVWNSRLVRRQIEAMARTTAGIYKVNQRLLGQVEIPVVPVDEQARLLEDALELDVQRSRLASAVRLAKLRTQALRRSLLAAAFSGDLVGRPSDLERVEELAGV